jgi:hypothetical protein
VGSGGATATVVAPHASESGPRRGAGRPDAGAAAKLPPALWEAACVIAEILLDQRQRALDADAQADAEADTT